MLDLETYFLEKDKKVSINETSFLGLKPGDLIFFDYQGTPSRLGLVVKSKRTNSGYFLSSRNNTLLNVFLLDSINNGIFDVMINILYKDRNRCTYKNTPRILGSLLGNNFRTFNVSKISNILNFEISWHSH